VPSGKGKERKQCLSLPTLRKGYVAFVERGVRHAKNSLEVASANQRGKDEKWHDASLNLSYDIQTDLMFTKTKAFVEYQKRTCFMLNIKFPKTKSSNFHPMKSNRVMNPMEK